MLSVNVDIKVSEAQLAEIRTLLDDVPNGVERVIVRSVNKVAVAARTQIVRGVTKEVALRAGELRERNITLRKASYSRMAAMVRISGRRVPLMAWGARQTRKGVSYAIRRGKRQLAPGAFIATMPTGHRGVFMRKRANSNEAGQRARMMGLMGKRKKWLSIEEAATLQTRRAKQILAAAAALRATVAAGERRVGRLGITELYGPSVPEVVQGIEELSKSVLDRQLAEKLEGEVHTQIGLVLGRRGSGRS